MHRLTDSDLRDWLTTPPEFLAGSNDDIEMWIDSDRVVWLLSCNTNLNYAGLSCIEAYDKTWASVIFVQANQHEHADALDYCEIDSDERSNYWEIDEDTGEIASVDIALLCREYPEQMRDYFLQWG